jgi:hypothetical protein
MQKEAYNSPDMLPPPAPDENSTTTQVFRYYAYYVRQFFLDYMPLIRNVVYAVAILGCVAVFMWTFLHQQDPDQQYKIVNFLSAWFPFAISIVIALIPDLGTKVKRGWVWRLGVVAVGFTYSFLLWNQQGINLSVARRDQQHAVSEAVNKSNEHSDQQIGGVRKDVQDVKSDLRDVKKDVQATISKTESALSADINKMKIFPPSEKATYEVSLWPAVISNWPVREKSLPKVNGVVTFGFSIMVKGHMAKQTRIWLRLCQDCKYSKEPTGFQNLNAHTESVDPTERMLVVGDFLPNIVYTPIINVDVIPPTGQTFFLVAVQVGCENCDPIEMDNPRVLRVNIQP